MSIVQNKSIKRKNGRTYQVTIERYNSAMEVASDCKTRTITNSQFHDKSKEDINAGTAGTGLKTYAEALELLRDGYQPIVDSLKGQLKLTNGAHQKRIKIENNITGFAPVVPLAMMGVPNNMINMTMRPIKAKVLNLYYDMTCSWSIEPEQIIEVGKQLLSAIMQLEQEGYKFNLYAIQTYSDSESADCLIVKIKDSAKPMDLKRMSFPLAHPAFFRVIGFDWYSRFPKGKYRFGYGHDFNREFDSNELPTVVKQILGDTAIYISASKIIHSDAKTIKEAIVNDK